MTWGRSSIPGTTNRTGILSSTRCRAGSKCETPMSVRTSGQTEKGSRQFEYLLRLGDDRLVLGHRLSEWCGHAPILEEDIALANIALDLIGQATLLLGHAGKLEGEGRDADALAYLRDAVEFRNALMLELPRGDFAFTIVRQFLYGTFALEQMRALER